MGADDEADQAVTEEHRRWDQIVEGDEIWSDRARKWFTVRGTVVTSRGTVKVFAKGIPTGFHRKASDTTPVRRGVTGDAVDTIQVIFSGQVARDIPESEEPA